MSPVPVVRRAVLWVPDWPVVAAMTEAGLGADVPAAVLHGRGLVAVSAAARAAGVRRGSTRRLAQRACPDLVLLPHDEGRDSRQFEAVAAAAEQAVSGVEISRPGLLMIPADGAARFHGSEEALAEALVTSVAEQAGIESSVGMADGLLAAVLAARGSALVPPGGSPGFLAPASVESIALAAMEKAQREEAERLASVLVRLGIVTLGDLASLPFADILARFGPVGAWAHRLASGQDLAPPVLRRSEEDIAVERVFEDPVERIDHLVPVAAELADGLDRALLDAGVRCGRVRITARTEKGHDLARVWRTDVGARAGAFARHMTDRVRWQLEGWLSGTSGTAGREGAPEPAPLVALGLVAEDVVPLGSEQSYLWGGTSGADARAHRALERVQGLLGLEGVLAVAEQGGRSPRDRAHLAPWGQEAPPARAIAHPWPGRIPDPPPATVPPVPRPALVLDAGGGAVTISRRLAVSAPPTWVRLEADPADERARAANRHPSSGHVGRIEGPVWDRPRPVESWAGPWPVAERWWSEDASRRAYVQVALRDTEESQLAVLLAYTSGRWELEAVYD
ncbi:DNA polymerase Y family protein [Demequina sp. SYSU T00039]|uniref:DNA polymerase Y family protein n=1 Tax=Demequina lignilytica TaxID=3051663 RepID=A0AAW7M5M5_9MICO|nr:MULTISPECIES: DNA polymerase Y family protein [unclassified Demequina]MDN4479056.1 DNA polymerase Y family protein [Demequina sp. SYSU T00039-1]MDN4489025.1 DNA polymerase Y family protein [Demequina sp. SYSU T00039]MDN4491264.1 DNA polymerase Y family protein [Demequina sp. SYSU T00068]